MIFRWSVLSRSLWGSDAWVLSLPTSVAPTLGPASLETSVSFWHDKMKVPRCSFTTNPTMCFTLFTEEGVREGLLGRERRERRKEGRKEGREGEKGICSSVPQGESAFVESKYAVRPRGPAWPSSRLRPGGRNLSKRRVPNWGLCVRVCFFVTLDTTTVEEIKLQERKKHSQKYIFSR